YELRSVLGRGGMATVYRAYSRSLDTDVAVKILAPRLAQDAGFRERHRDEARSMAGLHHPNLLEVHHFGEEGDLIYIVMRLVSGGTLKERFQTIAGPLGTVATARIISQIAEALQHAHERGLVHLDIKPANVLMGRADWPLLADFGITRAVEREETSRGGERLAGTPLYMSPEQCRGGPIDGRSDQYSLAITAFELLAGQRPFDAQTTEQLLQRHMQDPPPRPRDVNPGIPGPVEEVLLRGLAKTPEERYPTIRDFANALTSAADRTRGMTMETKSALSGIMPNLLAMLFLIVLGPLMLSILPAGARIVGALPLAWPFQLVLSGLIAGLLFSIRWHLIGLTTRALGTVSQMAERIASGDRTIGSDPSASRGRSERRDPMAGAGQGLVNLFCVLAFFVLVASPILAIVSTVAGAEIHRWASIGTTMVLALVVLAIVIQLFRSSGPIVASLALILVWAFSGATSSNETGLASLFSGVQTVELAIGFVGLVALLITRSPVQTFVRRLAAAVVGPLLAEARPGAPADQVSAGRRQFVTLVGSIVDVLYLLVAYALLRSPIVGALSPQVGTLPAALIVTGIASLVWILLTARLGWIAGAAGTVLGLLLGAPLLLSLPVLNEGLLGVGWPTTLATWGVGTAIILMLAAVRSQARTAGQQVLGPSFERRLVGTMAAPSETQSVRRVGVVGGLIGAFVDVALLLVAFWVLGIPIAQDMAGSLGQAETGSLLLVTLTIAVFWILNGPVREAATVLGETGGGFWSRRARALPRMVLGAAAILVACFAAVPAAIATPAVAGGLALHAPRLPVLVVDWEHWLPWTPSQEFGTYNLALSCSDGRWIGQFREAVRLDTVPGIPFGQTGRLGPTEFSCDDWRLAYFAFRQNVGLHATDPRFSWDWLDVQATINADESVDVTETHRVVFTAGSHNHLSVSLAAGVGALGPPAAGIAEAVPGGHRRLMLPMAGLSNAVQITDVEIYEGSFRYALDPTSDDSTRFARTWREGDEFKVGWWFPEVGSPSERTYTVRYRLTGALQSAGRLRRLEWNVLQAARQEPVWRTTVKVALPAEYGLDEINLGTDDLSARSGMLDRQTAWFEGRDTGPDTGLTIMLEFPAPGVPPETPTPIPSSTSTSSPSPTHTPEPSATLTPTPMPTSTPEPSVTPTIEALTATAEPATAEPATALPSTATAAPPATRTPMPTPTDTPTATSTMTPPQSQSFWVDPDVLCVPQEGSSSQTNLSWSTVGATTIRIEPAPGDVPGEGNAIIPITSTTIYSLS
ncbi:MAG TPA: serine/threonine-protein kinase, partial [Chloroflexota bacterium]|nr:serine/threonine-protein kinase [Chloroflexota bacterium]